MREIVDKHEAGEMEEVEDVPDSKSARVNSLDFYGKAAIFVILRHALNLSRR
jgi:hypothetical protein